MLTLFGQNAKIVNAKSDEQKAQTKTPKASLENNEKSELDELDEEILRLNANNIETKNESKTEIKSELQNEKNNFTLMLNKEPKTPEELQRQREQGVLKEANRLFGEPTIEG